MAGTNKSNKHEDTKATVSTAGGGTAGALAGAGVGAAVGGPVGAAVGAGIGAVTGAAAGGAIGYGAHEADFRKDFESSGSSGSHTWETASPAYKYGFESFDNPEYQGKSYSQVSSHLKKSWTGQGDYSASEPYVKTAFERRAALHTGGTASSDATAATGATTAQGGVIPVVEEELQVGKRQMETGGVRVTTSVTETPVETNVNLHSEKVTVQRQAVDRPVTDADAAFREGTIELKETAEQAVVNKRARVVEEIVLGKEGSDTTQKVSDSVRKTNVDVKNVATPTKVTHESYESFKPVAEAHHQANYASKGFSLEEFTPAYRYGHTLATDTRYNTGDWATVEPEARKHWEAKNEGTWAEFKDAIHHAWDKARGKA